MKLTIHKITGGLDIWFNLFDGFPVNNLLAPIIGTQIKITFL